MTTAALLLLLALLVAVVLGAFLFDSWADKRRPRPVEVLHWHRVGRSALPDYELAIRWSDGSARIYRGSCTVWHRYPTGARCCSELERWLSERLQQIRWQEEEGSAVSAREP